MKQRKFIVLIRANNFHVDIIRDGDEVDVFGSESEAKEFIDNENRRPAFGPFSYQIVELKGIP